MRVEVKDCDKYNNTNSDMWQKKVHLNSMMMLSDFRKGGRDGR